VACQPVSVTPIWHRYACQLILRGLDQTVCMKAHTRACRLVEEPLFRLPAPTHQDINPHSGSTAVSSTSHSVSSHHKPSPSSEARSQLAASLEPGDKCSLAAAGDGHAEDIASMTVEALAALRRAQHDAEHHAKGSQVQPQHSGQHALQCCCYDPSNQAT
jgi:hypothetical protein